VALILGASAVFAQAQSLSVAAAADLTSALPALAASYQKETGKEVKLSFGASGSLTTQIQNGAPFDIFFSADEGYPRQLIQAGLADEDSLYVYARGSLILWAPSQSPLDVEHRGAQVLLDAAVAKIAMANPQHAPYGRAGEAALRHLGLYDKVASRLVLGENIAQTAQFVESGNAQVGLLSLSTALSPAMRGKGKYWVFPADSYPPLDQAVVVMSHSSRKVAAAEFINYLKTPTAGALLKSYGFVLPEEKR
jgi:molybdate transport system substrate-binding protein